MVTFHLSDFSGVLVFQFRDVGVNGSSAVFGGPVVRGLAWEGFPGEDLRAPDIWVPCGSKAESTPLSWLCTFPTADKGLVQFIAVFHFFLVCTGDELL